MCIIYIWYVQNYSDDKAIVTSVEEKVMQENQVFILYCLFGAHIISYIFDIFRAYEIKKIGRPDINGVIRAPIEMTLQITEIFINCILFGFTIKNLVSVSNEELHHEAYYTYWIVIDSILVFTTQPYKYMGAMLRVRGDIIKNIYTLHFVQDKIM
jgi:hypothetical protein